MKDNVYRVVRSAAVAGWLALLFAVVFLAVVWFVFLGLLSNRPDWLKPMFGSGISWEYVQNVGFWIVSAFKMCIWLMLVSVIWLTLWARQLGKHPVN
jgi:hypothetical protein